MKRLISIVCLATAGILHTAAKAQTAGAVTQLTTDHARHPWALRQMLFVLRDRPKMARYPVGDELRWVLQGDEIWQWAAARFAGSGTGFWIGWDEDPPSDDFEADHFYRWDRGWIRILDDSKEKAKSQGLAFEEQWEKLVFEFFNQENASGFSELWEAALKGRISRDDYIIGNARLEHVACRKTLDFYSTIWVRWCGKTGFTTDAEVWTRNFMPKFEDWIRQYPRGSKYPWKVYGGYFDTAETSRRAKK